MYRYTYRPQRRRWSFGSVLTVIVGVLLVLCTLLMLYVDHYENTVTRTSVTMTVAGKTDGLEKSEIAVTNVELVEYVGVFAEEKINIETIQMISVKPLLLMDIVVGQRYQCEIAQYSHMSIPVAMACDLVVLTE